MMDFHPIASIFPLLEGDELQALADDIRQHGLREPIWFYEGKVLDGRNRAAACAMIGVEPVTKPFTGTLLDALAFVWSENIIRRHLDPGQAAVAEAKRGRLHAEYAAEVEKMKDEAKGRQRAGGGDRKSAGAKAIAEARSVRQQIGEPIDEHDRRTLGVRARAAGTNRRYLEAAEQLLDTAPQRLEEVATGRKTMSRVIQEVACETQRIKVEAIAAKSVGTPDGPFDVLVIDPPWPMERIKRECRPNQTASVDYPTMTLAAIEGLGAKIGEHATADCHLWLWTTHRFLPDAFRILEAWGFRYVCTFVWHKPGGFQVVGLPQYNCEFALYARKGSPVFIDTKALSTCFDAPRGKHSEKPEEFYAMVRRVTAGRRLDMFNRRPIEGFDAWGKESANAE